MVGRLSRLWLLGPALVLGGHAAQATTMVALSTEELFRRSDAVAIVQVLQVTSERIAGRITTRVELRAGESFKGLRQGDTLSVLVPGGVVDGWQQRVEGAPEFTAGETCVVYLKRVTDGVYHVQALEEGKLAIGRDEAGAWFVRRTATARLVEPSASGGWREASPLPSTEPMEAYVKALRRMGGAGR